MKILFTPYGGGSIAHIVRSLAVADALKQRGHTILFTAPTTKKGLVELAGYQVYGDGHPEVNLNDENDQGITYFRKNHDKFIAWLGDEIKAAEAFKPDIIVNSPSFFGPLASIKLGIPYVAIINAQWLVEFKGLLGLGRSRDHLSDRAIRRLAKPIFTRKFEQLYMDEIQSFYRKLEIPRIPVKRIDLHKENAVLIPSIPEFEPIEHTRRTNIHYVGPLFWNGFEKEPLELDKLFSDFKEKPFVYVSLGGSIYRKKSYEELIDALSKKHEWNILLTLGPNFPRDNFPEDLSHLIIQPYAPGLKACEYADVVINTASHGTVMQALWHGKPVIALPHNIDQATIASRLVELGIGINLNEIGLKDFSDRERYFKRATSISWDTVIHATERVLHDEKMKANAQTFKKKLRKYDHGDNTAADFVEKYASID